MAVYPIYFSDQGVGKTGLSPTIDVFRKVSDGTSAGTAPTVSELSDGFYKFSYSATEDIYIKIDSNDGTMSDLDRYITMILTAQDQSLESIQTRVHDMQDR